MKKLRIFILLLVTAIFVTCSYDPVVTQQDEQMKDYELAKYIMKKDGLVSYDSCYTFKDSAIAEAEMLAFYLNDLGDKNSFSRDSYSFTYDKVIDRRIDYYKKTGIALLLISGLLFWILQYVNESKNKLSIIIANIFLTLAAAMSLASLIAFDLSDTVTKVFDFKDVVNIEYFLLDTS
jgi:hypothetical protein